MLKIVDNHQILFDYQEMAIIKKFNKALDNLNKDPNASITESEDEEEEKQEVESSAQTKTEELSQAQYHELQN